MGASFPRRPLIWTVAATVLLTFAIVAWHYPSSDGNLYTTDVGGHETIPLADGSRVELNTDTRIRAKVGDTTRTVWLERGEAYFDIVRDISSSSKVVCDWKLFRRKTKSCAGP